MPGLKKTRTGCDRYVSGSDAALSFASSLRNHVFGNYSFWSQLTEALYKECDKVKLECFNNQRC